MAIFAHLEIENKLQLNDRTRLKADRSYVTVGADAITDVTIKPGADGPAISVFNANQTLWFLDFQFDTFNVDIDSSNNKIDFIYNGTTHVATIPTLTYTLTDLCIAVAAALNAEVSPDPFTCSLSVDNELTIGAVISSANDIELLPNGVNKDVSMLPLIGFIIEGGEDNTFKGELNSAGDELQVEGQEVRFLTKAILLTVTDGVTPVEQTKYIKIFTEDSDQLFSNDQDLERHEPQILKWIIAGRNTFKDIHRRAQTLIFDYLRRDGWKNQDGSKITKDQLLDNQEVKEWSTFWTLQLIFEGRSNSIGDFFEEKSNDYKGDKILARSSVFIVYDFNKDGILNASEKETPFNTIRVEKT